MTYEEIISELEGIRDEIETIPSGVDYEADPYDTSPDDAVAHVAGIVWQKIDGLIARLRSSKEDNRIYVNAPPTVEDVEDNRIYVNAAPTSELLSLPRMARRLGVTQQWLRSQAEAGEVPCLRAGKRLLFNPASVIEALAARAGRTTPDGGDDDGCDE